MTAPAERTFRWFPVDGKRHAIPGGRVEPGQEIRTLVQEKVTIPQQRPTKEQWWWPECPACATEAKNCTHVSLARNRGQR